MKILHLEDNIEDVYLIHSALKNAGIDFNYTHVASRLGFLKELRNKFDIILANFMVSGFDGFKAIEETLRAAPHIPLVFVSDTVGEEIATQIIKRGAADFVLKSNLPRLAPAVEAVLNESRKMRSLNGKAVRKFPGNEIIRLRHELNEKETMLREIHHRVKNNLQMISSLLKIQSQHIYDPQMLYLIKETRNRIMSMSLVHQRLYHSKDFSEVEVSDYLKKILYQIVHVFGPESKKVKIDLDTDKSKLNVETIIPCGMIVNEIVTNSIKHAFPDHRGGRIAVVFKQNTTGNYHLIVSDNGVGISEKINLKKVNTLGFRLIETLIKQIGAELTLRRENGVTYHISFKPQTVSK